MLRGLLFFLFLVGLAAGSAHAERRVALLLGNSAYPDAPLDNPRNDVELLKKTLKAANFDTVEAYVDLGVGEMARVIDEFEKIADGSDVAVFFYSGHGIEMSGSNYLVPIDARLERETDVKRQAIDLEEVINSVRGARKLQLILLDACRDNPFAKSMKRTRGVPTTAWSSTPLVLQRRSSPASGS